MSTFLHYPHGLIRRNLSRIERVFVAAGLAGLLYRLMVALPVYPEFWDIVILFAVFFITLYSPTAGYLVSVAAGSYPIYTISVYLFVIFFAIALLLHPVFIRNLGGTVLVVATPLLSGYKLAWAIPLLGGVWWGAAGGGWIGALAASWGMVAAGMAGSPVDWLLLMGNTPAISGVVERFGSANSLETLLLLLDPIATNSTLLLYHLLQVAIWAVLAIIIGKLVDRREIQLRRPWGTVTVAMVGTVFLVAGHIALGLWLEQYTQDTLIELWPTLIAATALAAILVGVMEALRDFFEHPLPPLRLFKRRRSPMTNKKTPADAKPSPVSFSNEDSRWQEPRKKPQDDDDSNDLIMLELD